MSIRVTNRALTNALKQATKQVLRQSLVKSIAPSVAISSGRLFSTSSIISNKFVTEVSKSIANELEHEKENEEGFPEELESFLSSSHFEIAANEGSSLAKLVKKTDAETINVFFDVNQVANVRPAETEEGLDEQEAQEAYEDALDNSYINLNVVIEKHADGSAIAFDVLMGPEDGATYIESVTTYKNAAEALTETSEAEHKRELAYNGPPFSNLDEALQVNLESYLVSRGVDEDLYQFVLNYGLTKENTEYVRWLNNLNKFFNN
jgi:complement component 1 Q subcomponent-binding protein